MNVRLGVRGRGRGRGDMTAVILRKGLEVSFGSRSLSGSWLGSRSSRSWSRSRSRSWSGSWSGSRSNNRREK